ETQVQWIDNPLQTQPSQVPESHTGDLEIYEDVGAFICRKARKEEAGSGVRRSDGLEWQQRSEFKSQAESQKPGNPELRAGCQKPRVRDKKH
ncbi:Hypothetical predicted protein, partial [Pelobates cultripes]